MFHLQLVVKVLLCHQIQMFQLILKEAEMEVMLNKVLNSKVHSHKEILKILNLQAEEVLKTRVIPKEEMVKADNKIIMVLKELIHKEELVKVDNKIIMVLKELILKEEMVKVDNKTILTVQTVYLVELKTILTVQTVYLVEKELLHKSYRTKQENLEKFLLM